MTRKAGGREKMKNNIGKGRISVITFSLVALKTWSLKMTTSSLLDDYYQCSKSTLHSEGQSLDQFAYQFSHLPPHPPSNDLASRPYTQCSLNENKIKGPLALHLLSRLLLTSVQLRTHQKAFGESRLCCQPSLTNPEA